MEEIMLMPEEAIAARTHWMGGEKAMPALDLDKLHGVPTKTLNQQVERNEGRSPVDFAFRLSEAEWHALRSQIVTSKGRGGSCYPPDAFTEHGVPMLSSVANSERAIAVNIGIMQVVVRMDRILMNDRDLMHRLERMEDQQAQHVEALQELFEAVKRSIEKPAMDRKRVGCKGGADV